MISLKNLSTVCFLWLFLFEKPVEAPETSGDGKENAQEQDKHDSPSSSRFRGIAETSGNEDHPNYDELFNEEALRHYTTGTETNPSEWLYHRLRGLCHLKMKNYDEAVENFKKAISRNPEGNVDRILLCFTLFYARRFRDVVKELEDNWNGSDLMTLGNIFYSKNKLREAIYCYDVAIKKNPEEILYYEKRAQCHNRIGTLGHAILDYYKILSKTPDRQEYRICLANALVDVGNAESAIKEILSTNDATEIAMLGNRLSSKKQFVEALKCYDEAIKRESRNENLYWRRGIIFLELEKKAEAIDDLKESLSISPNKFRKLFLIELLLDSERWAEAIIELITMDHIHLYRLADEMFKMNKFRQALYSCTEAINKAPKKQEYYLLRGNCNWKIKNTKAAIDDFKEALRLDGSLLFLNFWMDFCDLFLEAGKYLDAKLILEEKIRTSVRTENDEIKCQEIRKRITEMEETFPAQTAIDSELVELLKRASLGSTIPSASQEKGKNKANLSQFQADQEAIVEEYEQDDETNSPTTTATHKYALRTKRKFRVDQNQSSSLDSTDSESSGDEDLQKDRSYVGKSSVKSRPTRIRRRKSDSNQLLKLAVTNVVKKTRRKGKQKLKGEKPDPATSREDREKNADRESDPFLQFVDTVLEAYKDEFRRHEDTIEDSIRFLKPEMADPRILETADSTTRGQKLKTRSINNLYEPAESRMAICSPKKGQTVEEDESDFIARVWASELKKIANSNHKAFAKKVIDDILSEFQQESRQDSSIQMNINTSHKRT